MNLRTFRNRLAAGSAIGMAVLAGTLTLGSSGAFAGTPAVPTLFPSCSTQTCANAAAPQYYNGNNSQIVRTSGSDTTFYLMQQIGDLYNQAALYGCSVTGTTDFPCPDDNSSTTDTGDNWDRTEVLQGIDDVGSGDGQKQLCQVEASPDAVDIARSSKVNGNDCTGETAEGFAYDGVPEVDFASVNPSTFGAVPGTAFTNGETTSASNVLQSSSNDFSASQVGDYVTGSGIPLLSTATQPQGSGSSSASGDGDPVFIYSYVSPTQVLLSANVTTGTGSGLAFTVSPSPYFGAVDTSANLSANGGKALMGPVADGWEPGNAVGGPYTGTEFSNITSNVPSTGATSFSSAAAEAYRLYCVNGASEITDWGQLTNLAIAGGSFTDGETSTSSTTITSSNGTDFSGADVGDVVTASGIPANTIIDSVTGTSSATLSQAVVTGTVSGLSFTLSKQPGDGTPNGVPVNVMGVNPTSGTEFTISTNFFDSAAPSSPCTASSGGSNLNASVLQGNNHTALENNAANIGDFVLSDFPGDAVDQAAELASSLYYMSEGVLLSNSFARTATIHTGGVASGASNVYSVNKMKENGIGASSVTEGNDTLPTSRILWQMYVNQADPATQGFPRALTFTDGATTSGSYTLSSPAAADFQQSDIGRGITDTTDSPDPFPAHTYIVAVSPATSAGGPSSVTLNNAATATASGLTFNLTGAYIGVRASAVGFINWVCSTNTDGVLTKSLDHSTGLNYDTEVTDLIDNTYGFNRLTDTTAAPTFGNGDCGLIYPTQTVTGSAISNPYPGGVATQALPGGIPFPDN